MQEIYASCQRKINHFVLFFFLMPSGLSLFAQTPFIQKNVWEKNQVKAGSSEVQNIPPSRDAPANIIKLNLTSASVSNLAIFYERALGSKISLSIGGGYLFGGSLTGIQVEDIIIDPNKVNVDLNQDEVKGFSLTPELRFYPFSKKGAPFGFFVSVFGRYFNFDWTLPYVNATTIVEPYDSVTASGLLNSIGLGGGITVGAQFLIARRIVLDFYVGAGMAKMNMDGTFTGEISDPDYYQSIADDIKQSYGDDLGFIPLLSPEDLTTTANEKSADVSLKASAWPIGRVTLGIGYAF